MIRVLVAALGLAAIAAGNGTDPPPDPPSTASRATTSLTTTSLTTTSTCSPCPERSKGSGQDPDRCDPECARQPNVIVKQYVAGRDGQGCADHDCANNKGSLADWVMDFLTAILVGA